MIYRLTVFSFNYHSYTGIYDKMHGLTREVDRPIATKRVLILTRLYFSQNGWKLKLSNDKLSAIMISEMSKSFWTCQSFGLHDFENLVRQNNKIFSKNLNFLSVRMKFCQSNSSVGHFSTSLWFSTSARFLITVHCWWVY